MHGPDPLPDFGFNQAFVRFAPNIDDSFASWSGKVCGVSELAKYMAIRSTNSVFCFTFHTVIKFMLGRGRHLDLLMFEFKLELGKLT